MITYPSNEKQHLICSKHPPDNKTISKQYSIYSKNPTPLMSDLNLCSFYDCLCLLLLLKQHSEDLLQETVQYEKYINHLKCC